MLTCHCCHTIDNNERFVKVFFAASWDVYGLMFSVIAFSGIILPLMEIVVDFMITFGFVHGLLDKSSSTSLKKAGFFFGLAFPVLVHSSL